MAGVTKWCYYIQCSCSLCAYKRSALAMPGSMQRELSFPSSFAWVTKEFVNCRVTFYCKAATQELSRSFGLCLPETVLDVFCLGETYIHSETSYSWNRSRLSVILLFLASKATARLQIAVALHKQQSHQRAFSLSVYMCKHFIPYTQWHVM